MHPLHEQLREAWRLHKEQARAAGKPISRAWLLRKARLDCDATSLSRKLNGQQIMTTEECERIARALGVVVRFGPEARAA